MKTFVLFIVALGAIEVMGALWQLARNEFLPRTPLDCAMNGAAWFAISVCGLATVMGA